MFLDLFCNLWLRRMQISKVNCDEMDGDRPRQPANWYNYWIVWDCESAQKYVCQS